MNDDYNAATCVLSAGVGKQLPVHLVLGKDRLFYLQSSASNQQYAVAVPISLSSVWKHFAELEQLVDEVDSQTLEPTDSGFVLRRSWRNATVDFYHISKDNLVRPTLSRKRRWQRIRRSPSTSATDTCARGAAPVVRSWATEGNRSTVGGWELRLSGSNFGPVGNGATVELLVQPTPLNASADGYVHCVQTTVYSHALLGCTAAAGKGVVTGVRVTVGGQHAVFAGPRPVPFDSACMRW